MGAFGNGVIHSDASPVQLHAIGSLHCLFGILKSLKVNEGKTTGATRALVVHHIDPCQRSVARKHLPQVTLCGVQAQAKHPQTRAGIRVCPNISLAAMTVCFLRHVMAPAASVATPAGHRGSALAPLAAVFGTIGTRPGLPAVGIGPRA